ncbi:hypothetical protein [Neobacillus sp. NPDC093127]|uniref:hypothetical protein n=1 Tax=Neobacillus sp. NPDC093127 TaxID=3364296 RepID=UPI003820DAF8
MIKVERRQRRRYEELMFYGSCLVMHEFAEEFRTLLTVYGITWTEVPEGEYHIKFVRGPLNR